MSKSYLCRYTVVGLRFVVMSITVAIFCCAASAAALSVSPGLHVVGNHVITSDGQIYTPEGISIYGGLEARHYTVNTANVYAQIEAAAQYWHANTVRLQVAESNLFSHLKEGQPYSRAFLTALQNQVSYAHNLGMAVVVNDQTEFTNNTPSPTNQTVHFWEVIAKQFRSQPYVIFDIFNEPRLTSVISINPLAANVPYDAFVSSRLLTNRTPPSQMSSKQAWTLWRNGGYVNGKKYVGMQTVVNQIRSEHATNLIWAEGTYDARRLPPNRYLLHGTNLIYSIHHPNLNNPRSWQQIGNLASKHPVVEGEWAQYASGWAECYSQAYTDAPKYLNYLHAHQIGIIAWSLQANSLLKGTGHFRQPTNLNTPNDPRAAIALKTPDTLKPSYDCDADYGQGAGRLLQNYFAKNSTSYSL